MYWSAVNLGLLLLSGPQQIAKREVQIWDLARPSVAILLRNGQPFGEAALIDKSGLFLANQSSVSTPSLTAKLSDGRLISLTWKSTDTPTQTVLLQAEGWDPEMGEVVKLREPGATAENVPVIVVLPSGPVPGQLVSSGKMGVISSSRRAFPLSEVRFEANSQSVAGALVFDQQGQLVGLLNATLEAEEPANRVRVPLTHGSGADMAQKFQVTKGYGPADLTTGYTVGVGILRRVIVGFRSDNHKVQHPAIGVFCKDAPGAGALIQTVKDGSPAEKAGIQAGDIIIKMDDRPIKDQIDFARVIETKEVGDTLTITVSRGGAPMTFKISVGTIQRTLATPAEGGGKLTPRPVDG